MGYFSRYRPLYRIPERLTPDEARERRFAAMLERDRRYAEVPNFTFKLNQLQDKAARSRVAQNIVNSDAARHVKGGLAGRSKAASIAAALASFKETDFADPRKRALYRELRRSQGGQRKVAAAAGDKRHFNPTGKEFASTIYGTVAPVTSVVDALNPSSWVQSFVAPLKTLPCVQRVVRREVMFARGSAGRGYHTPKRRTWASGIPC